MRTLLLISLLIGSLAVCEMQTVPNCWATAQTKTEATLTPADEDNIREAVFRYLFEHNASGQKQNAKVYFLSIEKGSDPNDAFMLRFKDHKPPVKKRSQATGRFEVIDKETGERGLIFRAATIKQLEDDKVIVEGGYYEGGLSSSGNTYTVERKDHKWIVTKDQMRWIS